MKETSGQEYGGIGQHRCLTALKRDQYVEYKPGSARNGGLESCESCSVSLLKRNT
jgi:hypothetical protein